MATGILQSTFPFSVIYSVMVWKHEMQYLAKTEECVQDGNVVTQDAVVAVKKTWEISLVFQKTWHQEPIG